MEKITTYSNPLEQENKSGLNYGRAHRFEGLNTVGEVVSGVTATYLSKPFPHFYVDGLYTREESKSQGYASAVLEEVEKFLLEKRKPGLLVDGIHKNDKGAHGMYERRGWKHVPDTDLLSFNLPNTIEPELLLGYHQRYTETLQRLETKNESSSID
jgi:GNAT superfamily N-acetyltransferase